MSAALASGEEAIQMAEDLRPDLVLMDVALAGAMDGIEASRRMQLNRVVPVVYLTAYPTAVFSDPNLMQVPAICICKPASAVAEVCAVQWPLASFAMAQPTFDTLKEP